MPRYDYQCTNPECSLVEEKQHGVEERPEYACALCNAPMRKLFSTDVIIQMGTAYGNFLDRWKLRANQHFRRKYGIRQYVDP